MGTIYADSFYLLASLALQKEASGLQATLALKNLRLRAFLLARFAKNAVLRAHDSGVYQCQTLSQPLAALASSDNPEPWEREFAIEYIKGILNGITLNDQGRIGNQEHSLQVSKTVSRLYTRHAILDDLLLYLCENEKFFFKIAETIGLLSVDRPVLGFSCLLDVSSIVCLLIMYILSVPPSQAALGKQLPLLSAFLAELDLPYVKVLAAAGSSLSAAEVALKICQSLDEILQQLTSIQNRELAADSVAVLMKFILRAMVDYPHAVIVSKILDVRPYAGSKLMSLTAHLSQKYLVLFQLQVCKLYLRLGHLVLKFEASKHYCAISDQLKRMLGEWKRLFYVFKPFKATVVKGLSDPGSTVVRAMCQIGRRVTMLASDDVLVQILWAMQRFYSELSIQKMLLMKLSLSKFEQNLISVLQKPSVYFYVLIRSFQLSTETVQDYLLEDAEFLEFFSELLRKLKIEAADANVKQGCLVDSRAEGMMVRFMRDLALEIGRNKESYTYNVQPLINLLESATMACVGKGDQIA